MNDGDSEKIEQLRAYKRQWYHRNKQRSLETHRKWVANNKERFAEYRKEYREKNMEQVKRYTRFNNRRHKLRTQYNMTLEDYDIMFTQQNGVCAICHQPETLKQNGKVNHLQIDHCHTTGKVRGLLCHKCNKALGLLDDNIERFNNAIKYLNN